MNDVRRDESKCYYYLRIFKRLRGLGIGSDDVIAVGYDDLAHVYQDWHNS